MCCWRGEDSPVGSKDIICIGGPGYRLNEWIIVRDVMPPPHSAQRYRAGTGTHETSGPYAHRFARRQEVASPGNRRRTGLLAIDAERELDTLGSCGQVEFVGPSKSGFYRLKNTRYMG